MLYCHDDIMAHDSIIRRVRFLANRSLPFTMPVILACLALMPAPAPAATGPFDKVSAHVRRQIAADKQTFAEADRCTIWFYRRQRPHGPPAATGIAFRLSDEEARCREKYPKGLDEARADFSRTQSALSLSLTFFQLILVGDRNDDHQYSRTELSDLLDSFGPQTSPFDSPEALASALQAKFDLAHRAGDLELVMRCLSYLFEKGYRLTTEDQAALQGVMG